jgi:hypothetical protein
MEVRDAVHLAKMWVADVLKEEGMTNLGLEEVDFDDDNQRWLITVGFSRPWDLQRKYPGGLASVFGQKPVDIEETLKRDYRRVVVDDATGKVISMNRINGS